MSENDALLAVDEGFFAALNAMFTGDPAPMSEVWSHSEDCVYLGPEAGVFHIGWTAIWNDWQRQAALKLGGDITVVTRHVFAGQDQAAIVHVAEAENDFGAGKLEKVRMRGTNVYRLEDGAWKLMSHHSDPLPHLKF